MEKFSKKIVKLLKCLNTFFCSNDQNRKKKIFPSERTKNYSNAKMRDEIKKTVFTFGFGSIGTIKIQCTFCSQ